MNSWIEAQNPPHRIGGEAEAAIGVEFLHPLHQADIAFADQLADRQAIAAIAHGDLGHEPQVAGDELRRGFIVAMFLETLGEHELLLGREQREFANFGQVAVEAGFAA